MKRQNKTVQQEQEEQDAAQYTEETTIARSGNGKPLRGTSERGGVSHNIEGKPTGGRSAAPMKKGELPRRLPPGFESVQGK